MLFVMCGGRCELGRGLGLSSNNEVKEVSQ